ncbi:unnamed protein product [Effrenium voratum]|nr:unnamed protein product [Effrenium voratum]
MADGRQRRLVRLLLPLRDVEDAPAFARALEGEVAAATRQSVDSVELVSLDCGEGLAASFALGGGEAVAAASLGAALARGNVGGLLQGGQVQLVTQRLRTPIQDRLRGAKQQPVGAAGSSQPAASAGAARSGEPYPAHVPAAGLLDDKVAELLATAGVVSRERQLALERRQGKMEIKIRMQQAALHLRAAGGLYMLHRWRRRNAKKVRACLKLQSHWRSLRFRRLVEERFGQRRLARLQLQSWFRGIFGRRAGVRRFRALRAFGRVGRLAHAAARWLRRARRCLAAAGCIGRSWRGCRARRELAVRRLGLRLLQAALRQSVARARVLELHRASEVIQDQVRDFLNRQAVKRVKEMQKRLVEMQAMAAEIVKQAAALRPEGAQPETDAWDRDTESLSLAESIALSNAAAIQSLNATQLLAATAFGEILDLFQGDAAKLLKYMKVRAMRDHPSEHSVLGIRDDIDSAQPAPASTGA